MNMELYHIGNLSKEVRTAEAIPEDRGTSMSNPYKKNVLLIVHDVYQDFNAFPLAYGYLAAMLRKYGYSVEVYCMDVFHYTNEQLEKKLINSEYDLIGAGFMPARFEKTIVGLCASVKKHKKNLTN